MLMKYSNLHPRDVRLRIIFFILNTVDKKLELLREKKKGFERIKKGLMNDLLTGKARVTNLISKEV